MPRSLCGKNTRSMVWVCVAVFSKRIAGAYNANQAIGRRWTLRLASSAADSTTSNSREAADSSAISKSRKPFSSPRGTPDDSTRVESEMSWGKLGLTSDIVRAVSSEEGMNLADPTKVQRLSIPAILQGHSSGNKGVAFAAATGSGKTLAYLLPVIQALKGEELLLANASQEEIARFRRHRRPRALILAPTRELASQILSVVKLISHHCKISSELIIGGDDYGKQKRRLDKSLDVLVATPGRLVKHRDAAQVFLGSVKHVVIDEVDTMLEQGFQGDIAAVLHPMLYKRKGSQDLPDDVELVATAPQIVLTTATMTNAVKHLLGRPTTKKFPSKSPIKLPLNMLLLEAPGLHRAVPTLRQTFVDVGQTDKLALLLDVLRSRPGENLSMVFCNTIASARAAEHAMKEGGVESLCYHGEINSTDRAGNLKLFRGAGQGDVGPKVLVCTDIAARGLDVPEIDHVVMFDFPLNPIDYLHRAGRTARGTEGRVTALVAKRDRVLATAIEEAVLRGDPLDGLSSRKSDYLPGGRLGKDGTKIRQKLSARSSKTANRQKDKDEPKPWGRRDDQSRKRGDTGRTARRSNRR